MPESSATEAARKNPKALFTPKWDWPLAYALFIGGMGYDDILKLPQFQGMNKAMLRNRGARDRWIDKRRQAVQELGNTLSKNLAERLAEAADVHQEFMRGRLEKERRVLDNELIKGGLVEQGNRLKNLQMIDDMARKLTGLDDRKPLDPQRLNLSITVALAAGHQPQLKVTGTAISAPRNALLGDGQTPKTELLAQVPEQALSEAVSILRAKEQGTLEEFAKSEPTIDLEVDEIDRSNLKPIPTLKLEPDKEEALVNENEEDIVDILREAGYDARDITAEEALEAVRNLGTKNPDSGEPEPGKSD